MEPDIIAGLSHGLKAALFIVQHIPALHPSALPHILSRAGSLLALHPTEGMMIEQGNIPVAVPGHHLLIEQGRLHLGTGPKEHYALGPPPLSYFAQLPTAMDLAWWDSS